MNKNINKLKNFYLFAIGQFVSQFGSKMTSYGLILWCYKESSSVFASSFLTVCYLAPKIFLSFIAGGISDKWNKKRIMLVSDSGAAALSFLVLILLNLDNLKIEYLYLINFFLGIGDAFQNPASEVVISVIVSKEDYMKTSGIRSFFDSFTAIFVPVISVTIYSFLGLKYILAIDLLTFSFVFITLLSFVYIPEIQSSGEKDKGL